MAARSWLSLLAFVALSTWSLSASAYCRLTTCEADEDCKLNENDCVRSGVPLIWKRSPIVYRFSREGSEKLNNAKAKAAIRRAFETWSSVECADGRTSLRFEEGEPIDSVKSLKSKTASEAFGIYFRDEAWPHDGANESLALTNHIFGKDTGTIEYADIEVNTSETEFALTDEEEGKDFQSVMTHEAGHYIGLAHSNDADSIMVASYCESTDRCSGSIDRARELAKDDRKAVCTLYPPSPEGPSVREVGGCATTRGPGDLGAAAAVAFAGLMALRHRRRR